MNIYKCGRVRVVSLSKMAFSLRVEVFLFVLEGVFVLERCFSKTLCLRVQNTTVFINVCAIWHWHSYFMPQYLVF